MKDSASPKTPDDVDTERPAEDTDAALDKAHRPKEFGGRGGLDPTRYGDWEKAGRCIDF